MHRHLRTEAQIAIAGAATRYDQAKGIDAVELKVPVSIDAKAMINNEPHGLLKIVADKASRRVTGVHLLADHADTLFGEMARRLLSRLRRSAKREAKARTA